MTVERARVLKATISGQGAGVMVTARQSADDVAKRVPRVMVDAHAEAARLVAEGRAQAAELMARAAAEASATASRMAREARESELARLAAEVIAVRAGAERRAEHELDRTIELAVLLAERLVGEALAIEPARIAALAANALKETRGARQMRIEASPEDVAAMHDLLASLGEGAFSLEPAAQLTRGSLIVHTELGRVDARLSPQLSRLADALREVLRGNAARGSSGEGSSLG